MPATRTRDYARTTLRPRHRPVVRAIAEVFFALDSPRDVSGARLDAIVDEVDAFISPTSKTLRFGLLAMLDVLRWSPLLFGRFTTLEDLDPETRSKHLERLERSRIRQLPLLVVSYKTILSMLYYEGEDELRAIGYTGHERKRWLHRG